MMVAAHQLRSPLSTIKNCLQVILEGYTSTVDDKQRNLLERSERKVSTLLALVNDLLCLAQITETKADLKMESLSLADILQKIVEGEQDAAVSKEVTISLDLPLVSSQVRTNWQEMEQLYQNIIHNAIKYTLPGGSVEIKLWEDEGKVCSQITDSGIGIPEDDLPHICEEFYRAANAREEVREGTGLGLAIVKRVVETEGGEFRIRSELGQGTTVFVSFPAYKGGL